MIALDTVPLPNLLGVIALLLYIVTLLPSTLRVVFPKTRQTEIPKTLLKYRRIIGIFAFLIALLHGWILVKKRNFDFLDTETYLIYIQGVTTFIIFTLLAITSNDWSVKRLKKNWKRLHSLTYLAMFLLTWHIWDKMAEHWSYITPIALVGIGLFNLLFLRRRWLEYQEKQRKLKAKNTSEKPSLKVLAK